VAGLYFYNARWYDTYLNRWAQPDTIVPLASQGVQAWDRYGFVNNNPIKYNDPSGHCILGCIGDAMFIGGAIGAIAGAALYAANVVSSGQSLNLGEMGLAAAAGAVAGATIVAAPVALAAGSISLGAGTTLVSAATGLAASGGGYMAVNTITGNQFNSTDFTIASATGAVTGALGPSVALTRSSAGILNGFAGMAQYEVTTYAHSGKFALDDGLAWSGALGIAGGLIGGAYTKSTDLLKFPQSAKTYPFERPLIGWAMGYGYNSPKAWEYAGRKLLEGTLKSNLPWGILGGTIANLSQPEAK
jgi:RHS repeat-associated protein